MVIELIQTHPRISIIIIALLVSLFISLINYFVMDKHKVKEMKERQKNIRSEMKEHKGNQAKQQELAQEMFKHTGEQIRHSIKPMLITLIPVLVAFWWIKGVFEETAISSTWFWWYLVFAIVGSIIFRKLFKLP